MIGSATGTGAGAEVGSGARPGKSKVFAFLNGGADIGEALAGLGLGLVGGFQRSRTEDFFGEGVAAAAEVGRSGEPPLFPAAAASISLLSFTKLCTNPRPWSLLRLGVRSFC